LPFLEQNGSYWGPPPDDRTAIEELARMRDVGANFLAIVWPAFWWLAHYRCLHQELQSKYDCLVRNDNLLLFDLRRELIVNSTSGTLCASH
jgi:hypothetical protein